MTSDANPIPRQRTRDEWRAVLRRRGIRPERSMGQNFLTDPDVVSAIVEVAGIQPGDEVIEVGPGMGVLTRELLAAGAKVTAVELDRELAAFLRDDIDTGAAFTLIESDARHVTLPEELTGRTWHFVANLPYSTGNVILRHMLELDTPPATATVMVQKEVAERMVAEAPNMSLLSLAIQVLAEGELVFIVPPEVFEPPPKVDSAVVHLVVRPEPLLDEAEQERLFGLATVAFQQKRKTLGNSIAKGLKRPKAEVEAALAELGIDPGLRPQAVSLDQWCILARSDLGMSHSVDIVSPAKVNLGLEILGKRPDGFHEIRTVMAMVDLTDRLTVFEDELQTNGVVSGVAGSENLIRRALDAFRSRVPQSPPLGWSIEKRIPAAAGLGGASSNAAAALLAANRLAGDPLGLDDLHSLASGLGSDIPFFLHGPVGLASGRGIDITPLPAVQGCLVIITLAIEAASKTASMYGNLRPADFSDGSRTESAAALISTGQPLTADHLRNAFARASMAQWPEVERAHALLDRLGIELHALSGAGPSTYALVDSHEEALALERQLRKQLPASTRTFVTGFRFSPLVVVEQESPDGNS